MLVADDCSGTENGLGKQSAICRVVSLIKPAQFKVRPRQVNITGTCRKSSSSITSASPPNKTHMAFTEQRQVANVRERKRTEKLNKAFRQLQSIIPKEPSDKMSKIHTLKLTLDYINFLNDILREDDEKATGEEPQQGPNVDVLRAEGKRSSSTLSSPCSSSYYASNQLSPTGEDYEDDCHHRVKRRRSGEHYLEGHTPAGLSPAQPISSELTSHQVMPHNNDLVTSPLQSPNNLENFSSCFQYSPGNQFFSSTPSTCDSSIIYSRHLSPQSTTEDTSSLLRSAFREYRLTRRKIRFARDPVNEKQ